MCAFVCVCVCGGGGGGGVTEKGGVVFEMGGLNSSTKYAFSEHLKTLLKETLMFFSADKYKFKVRNKSPS